MARTKARGKLAFYKGMRKRNEKITDPELLKMWKAKVAKIEEDKKPKEVKAEVVVTPTPEVKVEAVITPTSEVITPTSEVKANVVSEVVAPAATT